ncbi:hypothetical protein [Glaciihabitans sp. UYNi722]|uniref:hypothetical protein n=1 Tax=Glaciihabitans sp. UYNi722 TaxID=3156344 RepID=UPI003392AAD7
MLFAFERRFTRNVAERVKDAAEAVVTARTEAFGSRLDDLEERLNARRAERESTQDGAVAAIAEDVSFDTISAALSEAERVGAIRSGKLTVPGSRHEPWLAVEFQLATSVISRGDDLVIDDGTVPKLTVEVEFAKRASEAWRPIISADWAPAMTSDEIGSELDTDLRRRDHLPEAKAFDFPLALRNLQNGLQLALENQRLPVDQETLHGTLYEVVTEDWVITSAGVENIRTGLLVSRESLGFDQWSREPAKPKQVAPPESVDESTWNYVVYRAGQQPVPNIFG